MYTKCNKGSNHTLVKMRSFFIVYTCKNLLSIHVYFYFIYICIYLSIQCIYPVSEDTYFYEKN